MHIAYAEATALGGTDQSLLIELNRAENLLKGIIIPPRPAVLVDVLNEQQKPEPDINRLGEIISEDVALSASTLKVVNSPYFGLPRKVSSIQHAVRLLGVSNIVNVVTGLMLHSAFKESQGSFMDAFWASSNRVAMIAALAAQTHGGVPADEAYAAGLLCDCGVPMLMRRFPDQYTEVFRESLRTTDRTSTAFENEALNTDHAVVGYLIGRSWQLPETICQCILHHHDVQDHFTRPAAGQEQAVTLLALLKLAHHINHLLYGWPPEYEWTLLGDTILGFLGFTEESVEQFKQEVEELN